jgi:hypothetical protein
MAKVDHTFVMSEAPEQAQAMFVAEIVPELHRKAELAMCDDEPGHVLFSDGIVDPVILRGGKDAGLYSVLREISGHHLHVDFEPEGVGTKVRIHGRVERKVRDGIELFGQPGRWPENGLVHE